MITPIPPFPLHDPDTILAALADADEQDRLLRHLLLRRLLLPAEVAANEERLTAEIKDGLQHL